MTDFFSQPDDFGDIRQSELQSSLGERLAAQAADTLDPKNSLSGMWLFRRVREGIAGGYMPHDWDELPGMQVEQFREAQRAAIPDTSIADAKARLKQEGLDGHLNLPDQPSIKSPVLDLMISEGHERRDRENAIARGPQGFMSDALGMVTSLGVGMIDPVNMAAFSIPVLGEARFGKLLASAGDSIFARAGVRTVEGGLQGAQGTALLQPADWWLHTQDGQDYTFADALKSIAMGAGMGAGFHAGIGAIGDLRARSKGAPLAGSAEEQIIQALGTVSARPQPVDHVPVTPNEPVEPPPEMPPVELPPDHPAKVLADLPPAAREDALHVAIADVISGEPVRTAEVLAIAADHEPRIAESLRPGEDAVDYADRVAREAREADPEFYSRFPPLPPERSARPRPEAPDPLDLAMRGELTAERAATVAEDLRLQQKEVEDQIFGDRADEWRKLHRASDRAWNNADDAKARAIDDKISALERDVGLTDADENWLNGQDWSDFTVPEHWTDLRDNLREIGLGRDDAIAISASEVRHLPKTRNWDKMSNSERQAVLTILSAMNAERAAGRDPRDFLREVFRERIKRYGGGADAHEVVEAQMRELAELLNGPLEREPAPAEARRAGAATAANDPRWRELADARPDTQDPQAIAESRAAEAVPEPESLVPETAMTAAEKAAADAEEIWRQVEPNLTEEARAAVNDALAKIGEDKAARAKIITEGAACLVAAFAA